VFIVGNKVATHDLPTLGYEGDTTFVEVTHDTAALSAINLGYSFEGDQIVLPMKYGAWVVALGVARFLRPTESTEAALIVAREALSVRAASERVSA
jgi:hypothetical protein